MPKNANLSEQIDTDTPMTLTIRDVVLIIVAVASMVTAWGLFGTRLTVVEEKIIFISNNLREIRGIVKEIKDDDKDRDENIHKELDNLEKRLRDVETNQAQIKTMLRKKRR